MVGMHSRCGNAAAAFGMAMSLAVAISVSSTPAKLIPASADSPASSGNPPNNANTVSQNAAAEAALEIQQFELDQAPETFGGVAVGSTPNSVIVYTTVNDPASEGLLQSKYAKVTISFRSTTHTFADMRALTDKLGADFSSLWASGIHVISAKPALDSGLVTLAVIDVTPAQRAELAERYGSDLPIVNAAWDEMPTAIADRGSDNAPWNGGDFITGMVTENDIIYHSDCTSGVPVHNAANQKFLLTASH